MARQISGGAEIAFWSHGIVASQGVQWVKNPSAMQETQETWAQSLSPEDSLEEGMATHSTILARRILWPEEPGGLQSMGLQRAGHNWSDWAQAKATAIPLYLLYWRHVPTAMGTKKNCLISKRVRKTLQNNSFNIEKNVLWLFSYQIFI